jgi:quinol monooxygenase YgiN
MPLIALTRLRVRSSRHLPQFIWYAIRSWLQLRRAPGCLALRLFWDRANTFWTASAWQDEAAMHAFMLTGAHAKAMPRLRQWCDEASVAHWQQDTTDLPNWRQAHRRMLEVGRPSKVNHPSAAHLVFAIPEPRATGFGASASRFRKAASPASDTSTHFGSGAPPKT